VLLLAGASRAALLSEVGAQVTLERWPDAYTAVSPAQCNQMLADGATGLMVGVWGGGYAGKGNGGLYDTMQANAQNSLRNMRQVGGRTAIYTNAGPRWTYPWGTIGPANWWEETQRAAGAELAKVSFIELDFEISDKGGLYIQSDDMLAFVAVLRTVAVPVIGYSSPWFTTLMHAAGQRYDYSTVLDGYNRADYADIRPTLECGLGLCPMHPKLVGHQYSGGTDVHGVNCDLNVIDGALYATQPAGGNDMTPEECKAVVDAALKPLADDLATVKKNVSDLDQWFFDQGYYADDKDYGNNASAIHKRVK